jgi:hypothetical protein
MSPIFLIEFAGKEAFLLSTFYTIAKYYLKINTCQVFLFQLRSFARSTCCFRDGHERVPGLGIGKDRVHHSRNATLVSPPIDSLKHPGYDWVNWTILVNLW